MNLYTRIVKLVLIIVVAVWLQGCNSTPNTSTAFYQFQSPEVSKTQFTTKISGGVSARQSINLTEPANSETMFFANIETTLGEGWAIGVGADSDAVGLNAKYQFNATELYVKDKPLYAVGFGIEKVTRDGILSTNTLLTSSDQDERTWWDTDATIFNASWIIGFRNTKNMLIYGGPFLRIGDANVTRDSIDTGSETLKVLGISFAGEYRFNNGFGVSIESGYANFKWGNNSDSNPMFGIKFDYLF